MFQDEPKVEEAAGAEAEANASAEGTPAETPAV